MKLELGGIFTKPKERIKKINLRFLPPLPVCPLTCTKTASNCGSSYKNIFF